ncbi:MAG: ABC-F family ATP-binding cassette domain-containing protein [Bacteroidota bacterium]
MTVLALDAVSKHFGLKTLLEDVTFTLEQGEKLGVIGANGSGKTTLLRLISGQETPDSGRIMLAGNPLVAYLPQDPPFEPGQTILEAVFDDSHPRTRLLRTYEHACRDLEAAGGTDEALLDRVTELSHQLDVTGGWDLEVHATAVLDRLGITDTSQAVDVLSGGQRKRVALARALILQPDLLILDEPTNHLDADTIRWLEQVLMGFAGALLLVTHDRYFLERITASMLELENGRARRYAGRYSDYLAKKDEEAAQHAAETQRRDNLMRRELAWLRRGAKARTTKQKARVDRAEALIEAPRAAQARTVQVSAATSRLGKQVVTLKHVSKSYDEAVLVDDFSLSLTRASRIGVIGPNGAGKSTLLKLISGRLTPNAGAVEVGQTVVIGYFDQESEALDDDQRVLAYIQDVAEYVKMADGTLRSASQMLEQFLFNRKLQHSPIGVLSGGERRRLYLLRILMQAPNVLLLDEPTNDLDIPTLVALEDYLDSFAGAVVVVSHDRYFLDRTVEHLYRFEGEGRVRAYPGNYSAFEAIRQREEAAAAAEAARAREATLAAEAPPELPPAPRSTGGKLSYKERRELDELEARIEVAEARKEAIEAQLAAPGDDYEALAALSQELQQLDEQLDTDVERWAELAERA